MAFDSYCIALVVLVLFFLYLDNSTRRGRMPLNGAPVGNMPMVHLMPWKAPPQPDVIKPDVVGSKQILATIGAKPEVTACKYTTFQFKTWISCCKL